MPTQRLSWARVERAVILRMMLGRGPQDDGQPHSIPGTATIATGTLNSILRISSYRAVREVETPMMFGIDRVFAVAIT